MSHAMIAGRLYDFSTQIHDEFVIKKMQRAVWQPGLNRPFNHLAMIGKHAQINIHSRDKLLHQQRELMGETGRAQMRLRLGDAMYFFHADAILQFQRFHNPWKIKRNVFQLLRSLDQTGFGEGQMPFPQ